MPKFMKTVLSSLWWLVPVALGLYLVHDISIKKAYWQGSDDALDSVRVITKRALSRDSLATDLTIKSDKDTIRVILTKKSFKYQ